MRGGTEGVLPPLDAWLNPLRSAEDRLDLLLRDTPLEHPAPRMPVNPDWFHLPSRRPIHPGCHPPGPRGQQLHDGLHRDGSPPDDGLAEDDIGISADSLLEPPVQYPLFSLSHVKDTAIPLGPNRG